VLSTDSVCVSLQEFTVACNVSNNQSNIVVSYQDLILLMEFKYWPIFSPYIIP